ncbi:thiamine phosphate synthase [Photobacterium sp. TY1-4]|uniref:thiamine phosphate synthase n=1 Tax=Photobacterium sp. TY1-4 TaxID=2899122 RepID=UPI0021BF084D|nr:thiamine phosphate synthase [Photobacterium sp. TY1-4]UXI01254.1 thiamine phosphate synthase [Photobacterium sp. TY1-4]
MGTLTLPEYLAPLRRYFNAVLASAQHYQLGAPVEVVWATSPDVGIDVDHRRIRLTFHPEDSGAADYRVQDQWLPPYPSLREVQQQVAQDPSLVICGLPTALGYVDLWHHHGEARAVFCGQAGPEAPQRAMLLAALALDYPLEDAVTLARAYARCYLHDKDEGCVDCWPLERALFPRPLTANHPQAEALGWVSREVAVAPFAKADPAQMALYPVVDSAAWVGRLLEMGVTLTQLRIKDPTEPTLAAQVRQVIAAGAQAKAQVYINDYWQLAIEHRAYGVHLGQEDLETADLAAIQQAGLRLGLSTHGYYEILRAAEFHPSYIALGHIYPTTTKQMPSKPQGLSRLALYRRLIGREFPTVAIGGIDLSRADAVWQTGVSSVAVVRAITQAEDPQAAVDAFYRRLVRPEPQHAVLPKEPAHAQ